MKCVSNTCIKNLAVWRTKTLPTNISFKLHWIHNGFLNLPYTVVDEFPDILAER